MDNLTHSLLGLTLARTPLGRAGRGATVGLVLASNAPDIDIVTTAGGGVSYLAWHRGPTHGPLGIIILGLLTALIVRTAYRFGDREHASDHATLTSLWFICGLGVLFHILLDLPTNYGTRLLSPFTWTWFTTDWMPIVDIYLLAILGGGLWLGRSRRARYARNNAVTAGRWAFIALALMLGNYGLRAITHARAIASAPQVFGSELPPPCDNPVSAAVLSGWPRRDALPPRDRSARHCLREVAAIPTFASPFIWRLIVDVSDGVLTRDIELLTGRLDPDDSRHYDTRWTPAAIEASNSRVAQVFLDFSRFPSLRTELKADGGATVRWLDIRFVVGNADQERRAGFFSATVDVGANGTVNSARLGR